MIISYVKAPDINKYMQIVQTAQVSNNLSLIIIYKRAFRGDDIIVDIYRDEISDNTKIISGRKLTPDSLVSLPKTEIDIPVYIHCIDIESVRQPIKNYNLYKFYLQFTIMDGTDWEEK